MMPIVAEGHLDGVKARSQIRINADAFEIQNSQILDEIEAVGYRLHMLMADFRSGQNRKRFQVDIRRLLQEQVGASGEHEAVSLGLAVLKLFLMEISQEWGVITETEAEVTYRQIWEAIYPPDKKAESMITGEWTSPNYFWRFLGQYLEEIQMEICLSGDVPQEDTKARIHHLQGERLLILPRIQTMEVYLTGLGVEPSEIPSGAGTWDTRVQRTLQNAGIPFRQTGGDITWKFGFHAQGQSIPCLGIPLNKAPERWRKQMEDILGTT